MVLQGINQLTTEVQKLVQLLGHKSDENTKLSQENATLRQTIAELTKQITELSWKSFRPTAELKNLLIGSSIIRDISDTRLVNTSVTSISGGVINDIKKKVSDIKDKLSHIYLVVGGNDCDNDDNPDH